MKVTIAAALLIVSRSFVNAQVADHAAGARPLPPAKRIVASVEVEEALDLNMLVGMSKLIVEGTVIGVNPGITHNPDHPEGIETHSIISIVSTLYEAKPVGNTVILVQEGGQAGNYEEVVPEDPIVNVGDRYLLFLAPDDRKMAQDPDNRFYVVGLWSGKVRITDGQVTFPERATANLRALNSQQLDAFKSVVRRKIATILENRP